MAELPDLTVFAQILNRKFKGKVVTAIDITVAKKLNVPAAELTETLVGKTLRDVKRAGKTLQFHFSEDVVLGLHLMLRGELAELVDEEAPRFQIAAFRFKAGKGFAVIDLQKQATLTLQPKQVAAPDALEMEEAYFTALLAKKRTVIKTLLMDQKLMRGIGNSYADEILYEAGISPFSEAHALPLQHVKKLYQKIGSVLKRAIKEIGEANGDELKGELKDFMRVHSPQLNKTDKGEEIRSEKIGGRTAYYTDGQELFI